MSSRTAPLSAREIRPPLPAHPKTGESSYPFAEVVLLNTTLTNIAPEGWSDADKGGNVRFWE